MLDRSRIRPGRSPDRIFLQTGFCTRFFRPDVWGSEKGADSESEKFRQFAAGRFFGPGVRRKRPGFKGTRFVSIFFCFRAGIFIRVAPAGTGFPFAHGPVPGRPDRRNEIFPLRQASSVYPLFRSGNSPGRSFSGKMPAGSGRAPFFPFTASGPIRRLFFPDRACSGNRGGKEKEARSGLTGRPLPDYKKRTIKQRGCD